MAASPVSFNFKKTKESSKVVASVLPSDNSSDPKNDTEYIQTLDGESSAKKPEKKEITIPLIKQNNWRFPKVPDVVKVEDDGDNLEALATREILEEAQKKNDGWENKGLPNAQLDIPLMMVNKVPSGAETDLKLDISLRPDMGTLENYETVPIEDFGLAMLRGMGWKASEGIGLSNKGVAPIVQASVRPKGLGLGANPQAFADAVKNMIAEKNGDEKLMIIKGAYVQVLTGNKQGLYGQIDSLDDSTGRAFVRMAIGGGVVGISELCLKPVTSTEYKEFSRVMNKEKYSEFKTKQERDLKKSEETKKENNRRKRRSRSRSRSRSPPSHNRRREHQSKSETKDHKSKKSSNSSESKGGNWLHPLLRVRCIDTKFKNGDYYKQKMVVIDVISRKHCVCKAENGKLLDEVSISQLETVIPRLEPAYVMMVAGNRKGQIGEIIERDKDRCIATVQILPDRDEIFKMNYNDICEYTGDIRNLC